MKKIIVFFVLAASLGSCTTYAQDTLWQKPAPLENYYNTHWIDTTERYTLTISSFSSTHINARQFFSQDTLQVYGIAAMILNFDSMFFTPSSYYPDLLSFLYASYPADPSFEHCETFLTLFQYNNEDSLPMRQIGDGLHVHMLHTPVSYWIMSNTPVVSYMDTFPKPVYERYFPTPQTVYDTFYVGWSVSSSEISKTDSVWHPLRSLFWCAEIGYPDQRNLGEVVANLFQDSIHLPCEWRISRNRSGCYFIFPILTPPDTTVTPIDTVVNPGDTLVVLPGDTLIIGGDTLVNTGDTVIVIPGEPVIIGGDTLVVNPSDSIIVIPGNTDVGLQPNDLIYRYTNVAPNPARNSVRITSSFGISRIEAYDLRGRRIYESPQLSTFSFPLSTIDWPRGTYLLRITTPAGPTTKKLLIQ